MKAKLLRVALTTMTAWGVLLGAHSGAWAGEGARTLEEGAPQAAQVRYEVGVQAYQAGRFGEAAREFEVALTMFPTSAKLAYNLARALERAEQYAPAVTAYQRYLTLGPAAADRAAVEATIKALTAVITRELPLLVVRSVPPGAPVFLDGGVEPAGVTPLEARVSPGQHVVRLTLDGHAPVEREIASEMGRQAAVDVTMIPLLTPTPSPLDPAAAARITPASPEAPARWQTWAGWGGVGAGAIAVGLGVVFELDARSTAQAYESAEVGDRGAFDRASDDIDAANLAAGVSFGGGAALLGAGLALLLWPEAEVSTTSVGGLGGVEVRW